jgi:hypothetical protein
MINAVEVIIGGVDRSPVVIQPSIDIELAVGGLSQARFSIDDFDGTWFPPRGESVEIRVINNDGASAMPNGFMLNGGTANGYPFARTLFGGTIRRWSMSLYEHEPIESSASFMLNSNLLDDQRLAPVAGKFWSRKFDIECTDFTHWFRRVAIRDNPSWTGQTLEFIVEDIVSTYMPSFGITTTGVATGPTLTYAITRPMYVADVFNELSALTGDPPYLWHVDEFANLYFAQSADRLCPFEIDGTYTFHMGRTERIDVSESDENYRNREVLVLEDGTVVTDSDAGEITDWGTWDKIEELRTTDAATAAIFAAAQLRKYRTEYQATIAHREHGAKPGQRINIYLPSLGLSGPYGITSVRATIGWDWMTNGEYEANVQYEMQVSRSGELLSDFREFFTRKLRQ